MPSESGDMKQSTQGGNMLKLGKSDLSALRRVAAFLLITSTSITAEAQVVSCSFDKSTLSFKGSALEQAKCLLRQVKPGGVPGPILSRLPSSLEKLIDKPVKVSKAKLREYLAKQGISEGALGGSIDAPISRGRNNDPLAPFARYFVIHDTSTPNLCASAEFPPNIDQSSWEWNDLNKYKDYPNAHLYITRDGMSITAQNRTFQTPWRATKVEGPNNDVRAKGMFLHIENVQPRRCDPDLNQPAGLQPDRRYYVLDSKGEKWVCRNDRIAADPGFSEKQMDRLALVYIAASVRRGTWLIPAFHATADAGIPDAHDDPQNFDLQKWADRLSALLRSINAKSQGKGSTK